MILIKYIWRIHGYVAFMMITILLYPLLFISTLSDKFYNFFYLLGRIWGGSIFTLMGFYYSLEKENKNLIDYNRNYIIVANHGSFIDIFLMYFIIKTPTVFMGKKELAKIPIFSRFYKKTSILVDRNSIKSKSKVYKESIEVLEKGRNICIFPEGGIPKRNNIRLGNFKDGAFGLAKESKKFILPITFPDNKILYPYSWKKGKIGRARIFIHNPVNPEEYNTKEELRDVVYNIIDNKLKDFGR